MCEDKVFQVLFVKGRNYIVAWPSANDEMLL